VILCVEPDGMVHERSMTDRMNLRCWRCERLWKRGKELRNG
jgi:hypothetical protein